MLVRKSWSPGYKLLVALSCMTLAVETTSLVYQYMPYRPPLFYIFYNVWIFLEPATMIYILFREATHPAVKRLCRVLLMLLPISGILCHLLSYDPTTGINEYANLVYLFFCLIAACSVLMGILLDTSDQLLFTRPVFWLATGILFYSCIFIVIHAIGAFYFYLVIKCYIYFSTAANAFQYGGFIACYFALRKRAIIAIPSSGSSQGSPRPPLSPDSRW